MQQLAAAEGAGQLPVATQAPLGFSPLGNHVPKPRFSAARHVGVTFFECSRFSPQDLEILRTFDLVVSGSRWNQALLQRQGVQRARLVHQGVDTALFNPEPVPRLLKRSLVIFSGGKLENRKGQDIVIAAFRRLLSHYPDALLIAAWGNVGHVGLNTIAASPHVQGAPERAVLMRLVPGWRPMGCLPANVFLLPCVVNRQLPHLIKQADVAVFASRCEGGTNLMAMETLACGVPTLISANTGHLDLLAMGFGHALPMGQAGLGRVAPDALNAYGGDPWGFGAKPIPMNCCSGGCGLQPNARHGAASAVNMPVRCVLSAGVRACAGCCQCWRSCRPRDCTTPPPGFGAADHARFLSLRQLSPQRYSGDGSGGPFASGDGPQPFHLWLPCRHLQGVSA